VRLYIMHHRLSIIFWHHNDGTVKSPSMDFFLTEIEKCDFRSPYKSTGCHAPH